VHFTGILLAAGRGERFGGAKLLAPLARPSGAIPAGTAVGVAACRHLLAALPTTIAVVRPGDAALAAALTAEGARVIECAHADKGMGASLACAVAADPNADGWIVALGDMPWIRPATIAAVTTALTAGHAMVAPALDGERGHPVGFARAFRSALLALTGDQGARAILASHRAALHCIPTDDPGVLRDIDVVADL